MATEKTDPNFKDANYHQNAFIAISQAGQIRIGIFEHAIQHLIYNKLDFSHSNKRYNNANGGGAAALNPAILLKIILLAHSRGCTSSRVIANYKYYKVRAEPFDRVLKETYGNSYT